jgi:hypothetical protein
MEIERHHRVQRALYTMLAADVVVVGAFTVAALTRPNAVTVLAPGCFAVLLLSNFLFLRRKLRMVGQTQPKEGTVNHSNRFSLYACSAIFFVGTLYGLLMIWHGQLPRETLPLLLVPLSLAVYCLKIALKPRTRKSD